MLKTIAYIFLISAVLLELTAVYISTKSKSANMFLPIGLMLLTMGILLAARAKKKKEQEARESQKD
jgi:multidrug transporter EmrE-like cation transporter